jgi:hypothetical protein
MAPPGSMSVTAAGRTVRPGPGTPAVLSQYGGGPRLSSASRLGRMNPQLRELLEEITFAGAGAGVSVGRRDRGGAFPLHDEEEPAAVPNMAPYFDHTPTSGTMCYVTGHTTDSTIINTADVDGGKTSLTTPTLDLTVMAEPTIGYWRWFTSFHSGHGGPDPSDYLTVLISNDNGANWTAVDTTRGLENHWTEESIRVADYVTPTTQVKLRFVAADIGTDTGCEAGIDDLVAYDAATAVGVAPPLSASRLAFRAPWPNPAAGIVRFVLEMPAADEASVEVLDLAGRRIQTLHRGAAAAGPLALAWDGRDASGRESPAGLYFARATVGVERALARFVRVR